MKFKYLLFFLINLLFVNVVHANDIKSINMDIYIDNNGNAHIKEKWLIDVTSGTEVYKPYYNMKNSDIIDYKVIFNNQEFTTIPNWEINASFEEKSYKAGINKNEELNKYELCFGITKFGLNTYEFDYTITNFVLEATDADVVYWALIPNDLLDSPESTYIKIYSDFEYDDTLKVWGYGNYGGGAYVHDGYIEMKLDDNLKRDEYMAVLIKFPKDAFNNNIIVSADFNYYYTHAEKDSVHYEKNDNGKTNLIDKFIYNIESIEPAFLRIFIGCLLGILMGSIVFMPIIIIVIYHDLSNKIKYGTKKIKFRKEVKNVKKAPYFRDIPCENIFEGYWISCQFDLVKRKTDFLGVMILKWLKDKNIEIIKDKKIKFITDAKLSSDEKKLYDMMKKASKNNILEEKEFSKWCQNNSLDIIDWFDKIFDKQTMKLYKDGKLTKVKEKDHFGKLFIDGSLEKTVYYVEKSMKKDGLKVSGLKNFLNDFSNIKDRNAIEIIHWEEYLMYAQMFGIADKVSKEFKDMYPEIITDATYDYITSTYNFAYSGINSIINVRNSFESSSSSSSIRISSSSQSRADSYSSGGGGYSSGGGASDSFGKGAGGGGVR